METRLEEACRHQRPRWKSEITEAALSHAVRLPAEGQRDEELKLEQGFCELIRNFSSYKEIAGKVFINSQQRLFKFNPSKLILWSQIYFFKQKKDVLLFFWRPYIRTNKSRIRNRIWKSHKTHNFKRLELSDIFWHKLGLYVKLPLLV